jgi:hypothetical protein
MGIIMTILREVRRAENARGLLKNETILQDTAFLGWGASTSY